MHIDGNLVGHGCILDNSFPVFSGLTQKVVMAKEPGVTAARVSLLFGLSQSW